MILCLDIIRLFDTDWDFFARQFERNLFSTSKES